MAIARSTAMTSEATGRLSAKCAVAVWARAESMAVQHSMVARSSQWMSTIPPASPVAFINRLNSGAQASNDGTHMKIFMLDWPAATAGAHLGHQLRAGRQHDRVKEDVGDRLPRHQRRLGAHALGDRLPGQDVGHVAEGGDAAGQRSLGAARVVVDPVRFAGSTCSTLRWTCGSTPPGRTNRPWASISRAPVIAPPSWTTRPPATPTSARSRPSAFTIVPPRRTRSRRGSAISDWLSAGDACGLEPCRGHRAQVPPGEDGVGVAQPERVPQAVGGAPEQRLRAREAMLVSFQHGQVVDGQRDVRVVASEEAPQDRQRPRVQRPGARDVPALLFDGRQSGQPQPELQAPLAELAPEDRLGPPVEDRRLIQAAAGLHHRRQRRDVGRPGGVRLADGRGAQRDRAPGMRLGFGVTAAGVRDAAQVVLQRGARLAIAAEQALGLPVKDDGLGVAPLGLAQDPEVVEHPHRQGIPARQPPPRLRQHRPIDPVGGGVGSPRAVEAGEGDPGLQPQAQQIGIVRRCAQDRQGAAKGARGFGRTIACLQGGGELAEGIGDVGVAGPLGGRIARQRPTAGLLGRGEAPGEPQGDGALVGGDGVGQVAFGAVSVESARDGCHRAAIVAWAAQMSSSSSPSRASRRFFAPEVIQTSAMDCGPAALKCLLEGFGVGVSYGRLREACQTSVDGTSIDTLETLGASLGLDAEQVMMPVDHLLLPEADALPAIVVTRLPSGLVHFVVVWRLHGAFVQIMDPARGRRWVRRETFLRDVHVHRLPISAEAFREWAGSDGFTRPLGRRLRALGAPNGEALIARALEDPGWSAIAALDGATRTVAALVASGAVARGAEASRLVASLTSAAARDSAAVPPIYATAAPAPAAEDGTPQVTIRGAVLLRASAAAPLDAEKKAALPVELRVAVEEPRPRAAAELWRLLAREGRVRWTALAVGVVLAALGAVAEALLFRSLIDLAAGRGRAGGGLARLVGHALGGAPVGPGALAGAIVVLLLALLALELPLTGSLRRAGARLEEQLRALYLRKIPRLPDRYFQSRPVSDMAERAHLLHRLRTLPTLGGEIARTAIEIVVVAGGLAWLDPRGAGLAIALGLVALLVPFVAEPAVAERDLRMRNHAGALGRFYLDGLLGLVAVRTHGAEPALAREHRDRLREWVAAARRALGAALTAEAVQTLLGLALAVRLLVGFFAGGATTATSDPGTALLLVYWALSLPALGQELTALVQQLPAQRNLTLRLLEPLGAPEDDAAGAARGGTSGASRACRRACRRRRGRRACRARRRARGGRWSPDPRGRRARDRTR